MTDPFDLRSYGARNDPQPDAFDDYRPGASGDGQGFGQAGAASLDVGSPPVVWLAAALAAAVVGGLLAALVLRTGWVTVLPWVVAGPVAIVLLGVFSITDTRRRAMPIYAAGTWVRPAYGAVVVVVLVAVVISALNIAFWAGRL